MGLEELTSLTTAVHAAVQKVCPIVGVSIGDPDDKRTWQASFAPEATAEERQSAEHVISDFDFLAIPAPVPEVISDRQFFQQLAMMQIITEEEAEAAVGPGIIPDAMLSLVGGLPPDQQFRTRMLLKGATQFHRSHPTVTAIAAAFGWSGEQTDDFWRAAAMLL